MHNIHVLILKNKRKRKKIISEIILYQINTSLHCCYPQLTMEVRVLGGVHSDGAVGFGSVADSSQ